MGFFDAAPEQDHILLNWETASESAGTQFEIQRSTDPQWGFTPIYTLNGQGLPNRMASYAYRDHDVKTGVTYYYRILNTDPQGKNMPTEIRMAKLDAPKQAYSLFPTLVRESFTLQGSAYDGYDRRVQLSDLSGRVVLEVTLSADELRQTIYTGLLPNGMYIATVTEDGHIVFSQKISKAP